MNYKRIFPCVIAAYLLFSVFAVMVTAQSGTGIHTVTTNLTTTTIDSQGVTRLETDPIIISRARPTIATLNARTNTAPLFDNLLHSAIGSRLGARYVWGASGPRVFDCSGFVWSAFQELGADFTRGSARSYWARFAPATEEEKTKFGTLVFFNNLSHVGIVADEHGFYHASRRKGVIYSRFDKYPSRIDGYRRVPLPAQFLTTEAE